MGWVASGAGQVLLLLRTGQARTASEFSAALGIARSTVGQRLEALAQLGLVSSVGENTGARGRPQAIFRFEATAAVVVGVQVGIVATHIAVTDLAGGILTERRLDTDSRLPLAEFVDLLDATLSELLEECQHGRDDVLGVGVGLPSSLELMYHRRRSGSAERWGQSEVRAALESRIGKPIVVDRDVSMLAVVQRAEVWPTAGVLVCVKLGSVITSAIVVDGRIVEGASDAAGEFGHLKVNGSTERCVCGATGCLEATAGAVALVAKLRAAGLDVTTITDVITLAERGERTAVTAVRDAGRLIGEALGGVVNMLNPDVICAWGEMADAETQLFAGLREGLYATALPWASDNLVLARTNRGEFSGVLAAAEMVIERVLDPAVVDEWIESGLRFDSLTSR